jgi:hypothetical protein
MIVVFQCIIQQNKYGICKEVVHNVAIINKQYLNTIMIQKNTLRAIILIISLFSLSFITIISKKTSQSILFDFDNNLQDIIHSKNYLLGFQPN